jgi:hypothetical protein
LILVKTQDSENYVPLKQIRQFGRKWRNLAPTKKNHLNGILSINVCLVFFLVPFLLKIALSVLRNTASGYPFGLWTFYSNQMNIYVKNKMKNKNTTLSEHFQNPIKESLNGAKSIPLTYKYMTVHFPIT